MVEKFFKEIIEYEEIKGHFNKNFKVKTNDGLFHLKVFRDNSSEIKKWISGDTVKVWDIKTISSLEDSLKILKGSAPEMILNNLNISDVKYLKLLEKYEFVKKVYCHNDINKDNVIINESGLHLIDFEFDRMNHPYWEYANIIVEDKVDINIFLKAIPSLKKDILEDWIYINKKYTDAWKRKWKNNSSI